VAHAKLGYLGDMEQLQPRHRFDHAPDDRMLRRIIVTAGLVLLGVILAAAAIYAAAFLMLAPMMQ
jgi:hypothetical protein